MRKSTKKHLDNIVDCCTGADGGISFTYLKGMITCLDKKAANGCDDSKKILAILERFSKLINLSVDLCTKEK